LRWKIILHGQSIIPPYEKMKFLQKAATLNDNPLFINEDEVIARQ